MSVSNDYYVMGRVWAEDMRKAVDEIETKWPGLEIESVKQVGLVLGEKRWWEFTGRVTHIDKFDVI